MGLAPLLVTAPSLPKYSSSLAPFKRTPLADDSMRKCRTSSLLSSPSSDTKESVSAGVSAAAAPLPAPGSPGCPQLVLAQGGDGQAQILLHLPPPKHVLNLLGLFQHRGAGLILVQPP